MYFLINDSDNSVNAWSNEPIPSFMNHTGTTAIEKSVDQFPDDTDWHDLFYDPSTDTMIPNKLGLIKMETKEVIEYIEQQKQIQQAITQAETKKYQDLVTHLASLFPNDPKIKEILSDGVVTQDELQQIENMLNAK